jgi:hypothetical protein
MGVCRRETRSAGLMSVLHRHPGGLGTKAHRFRALRSPKKVRVDVVLVRITKRCTEPSGYTALTKLGLNGDAYGST